MASLRSLRRALSRIGFRLLLTYVVVVAFPALALLSFDWFEQRLLAAENRALGREAEVLAAALSAKGGLRSAEVERALREIRATARTRARLVDVEGWLVADSALLDAARQTTPSAPTLEALRWNERGADVVLEWLARRRRAIAEPEPDPYAAEQPFLSAEILGALAGRVGTVVRVHADAPAPVLYAASPVHAGEEVIGAVLLNRAATDGAATLRSLQRVVIQVEVLALLAALGATLLGVATIARPLRRLRSEAETMFDRRGRIRGRLSGARRHDEIGDLARTLEAVSERLEERVGFIEGFAADVSHEFKNPLASIRVATEILADTEEPRERRRFLAFVERDVARMEHLLNALREVTSIDAQRDPGDEAAVDLSELLAQLAAAFRMRVGDRVKIEVAVPDEPVSVYGGQDRLAQVFENLLDNAVSFSPDGGRVLVQLARSDGDVVVSVGDEGPGIPEHHRERIFRRFFSYRPGGEDGERPHTGLGLAIVKAIVEGYGGSVTAEPGAIGGALIVVRLPAWQGVEPRRRGVKTSP